MALGFEPEAAQAALRKHKNNIQNAVDDLIKHDGVVPSSTEESSSSSGSGKHSAVISSYNGVCFGGLISVIRTSSLRQKQHFV